MTRYADVDKLYQEIVLSMEGNPHTDAIVRKTHDHEHTHFLAMLCKQPTVNSSEILKNELVVGINEDDIKMAIMQLKSDERFIAEINLNKLMAYDLAISVMQKLLEQK